MNIEVFYLDGCPNHQPTVARVKHVLEEMRLTANITQRPVAEADSVRSIRFLGSPTVHVDGVDVEPSARTSTQFGFGCRTYLDGQGREGVPPAELIREALLESGSRERDGQMHRL
ncbi:MAG TPA: hypothetical protein VMZ52_03870 [Bryobacteraceae bacterium]|nr:hypothetical protein [Bryobacteraceae bacterium]